MTGAPIITTADREAGLVMSLALVIRHAPPGLMEMLQAFLREGHVAADPVACFYRGDQVFASVEFEGVSPLPAPVLLRVERA